MRTADGRLGVVLVMLTVAGCGRTPAPGAPSLPPAAVPATASAQVGENAVSVFTDGGVATANLLAAVSSARRNLDAEIYEFGRQDLLEGMVAASHRGVRVRMIGDPTVAVTVSTGRALAAAGATVAFFPLGPRQIDHVKLLVVDGEVGYFGGVNWGGRSYLNRDYELAVRGPEVERLEGIFRLDLARAGAAGPAPPVPSRAGAGIAILTTFPGDEIGRAVVRAIAATHRRALVESFVLTDTAVIKAMQQAAHRGVSLQVLFDPSQDLNQAAMAQLRTAGIACRFYRSHGEKLHAKAAVLDDAVLIIGSANWTASGFRHNHELDAILSSRTLAAAVRARMEADWAAAA